MNIGFSLSSFPQSSPMLCVRWTTTLRPALAAVSPPLSHLIEEKSASSPDAVFRSALEPAWQVHQFRLLRIFLFSSQLFC